jgi:predicted transcriptional regulator of viral defense system
MSQNGQTATALAILSAAAGPITMDELEAAKVSRTTMQRLVQSGRAVRIGLGRFVLEGKIDADVEPLVSFALQVPGGVVALLSAAARHGMTEDLPAVLYGFVPRERGSRIRLASGHRIDVITSRNPDFLDVGIETTRIAGVDVSLTTKERTLVDLFLFSPLNTGIRQDTVRVPAETFMESLNRCTDDPGFDFDKFHLIVGIFGCAEKIAPFSKSMRFRAAKEHRG